MRTLAPLAAVAVLLASSLAADADNSRRDREDPELVLETGGRTGACDDLCFTPDGKQLLAVGDDKVVRVWSFANGKIDPKSMRTLRWDIWREQRGAIYAVDVSPDGRYVAIAGLGAATATVARLDLASGAIHDLTVAPNDPTGNVGAFWAAAFAPSGKRVAFGGGDGSVWVWDFHTLRLLGKHHAAGPFDTVRLLRFTDENHLLSLAQDGELLQWDPDDASAAPVAVVSLRSRAGIFRAELSPDHQWLAAAPDSPFVRLRSLDGKQTIDIPLNEGEYARALAFDPAGQRLAVAVAKNVPGARFSIDADDRIVFYDLARNAPTASPGPPHAYRAERLAFSPDGDFLAVAGGENQEVTLWDLARTEAPASVLRGTGSCLWDVALSQDGGTVGFRDQRDPASTDPNARGRGPWRTFDLARRQWTAAGDFKPVPRLASAGGWTIEPDPDDPYVWWAVHESGVRRKLPLDRDFDGKPRCWTFLPPKADGPVRLAVGHYWGLSVIELTKEQARRVRLCVGHQGEVVALAPSADGTWLVSCSNDMTLAAWGLAKEWKSQPLLGAKFESKDGALVVTAVDAGGPAWEAGVVVGDVVTRFAFDAQWMKDDPGAWQARLADPVPGREHAFQVRRGDQTLLLLTRLKQRPLWRFFPAGGGEWVIWMWRNNFYDASAKGDYAVGWHVNASEPKDPPAFYQAQTYWRFFKRPDVINKLLKSRDPTEALSFLGDNPLPLHFDGMEPPAAELTLRPAAPNQDVEATLSAYARGDNPDEIPVDAELWINDYQLPLSQSNVQKWAKTGKVRTLTVTVPYKVLRAGENVVTFQTWNRLGGRADAAKMVACARPAPAEPRLIGLTVGINDYKSAKTAPGKGALGNLKHATDDAKELSSAWADQKLYGRKEVTSLLDAEATRQAILKALDDLARTAQADDVCFVFLSGHGDYHEEKADRPGGPTRSVFVFCPPEYDPADPYNTGISNELLARKLAAIPCRKLLMLDACHSGAAADNPARGFAPDGQGPVVLAACDLNQSSLEHDKFHHGLFTYAVLNALDDPSAYPDHDGVKELFVSDLYHDARKEMPKLLGLIGEKEGAQVPILFAPGDEDFPVARAN